MKRAWGGPRYQRMTCLNCLSPTANARLDKNGGVFVSCDCCKTRNFGLMPRGVAALHFISEAIRTTPELRSRLERHCQAVVDALYAPPAPAPAAEPAPAPANAEAEKEVA